VRVLNRMSNANRQQRNYRPYKQISKNYTSDEFPAPQNHNAGPNKSTEVSAKQPLLYNSRSRIRLAKHRSRVLLISATGRLEASHTRNVVDAGLLIEYADSLAAPPCEAPLWAKQRSFLRRLSQPGRTLESLVHARGPITRAFPGILILPPDLYIDQR
jgi:hypothetical protein